MPKTIEILTDTKLQKDYHRIVPFFVDGLRKMVDREMGHRAKLGKPLDFVAACDAVDGDWEKVMNDLAQVLKQFGLREALESLEAREPR